jgi:hypothetical protein
MGSSVDHLFFHCDVAYAILIAFFSCFGLPWVMPIRVVNMYIWWTSCNPRSAAVWKMVPTFLLWCLLREMNAKSFEDRERT